MEPRIHILITGRHLERCHARRAYGVHPAAVNQIAAVRPGDQAYLFSKVNGRVYGPYVVVGEAVYLPEGGCRPIWETERTTGKERFRVVFRIERAGDVCSVPIKTFYSLARATGITFHPEDVINRSIMTFLPEDGRLLASRLGALPWQKEMFLDEEPITLDEGIPIKGLSLKAFAARERVGESFIEYLLTTGDYFAPVLGEGEVVWNQLRIPGERSRIDLLYKSRSALYVIELKLGAAGRAARREAIRYGVWARANRRFLERQFADRETLYVQPAVVGSSCPGPTDTDNLLITYRFDDGANIELRRLN